MKQARNFSSATKFRSDIILNITVAPPFIFLF